MEDGSKARSGMRLFLDSADPVEWRSWLPMGLFFGVTTNPALLQRAGQPCTESNLTDLAAQAFVMGAREVQIQTWGPTASAMTERGRRLAAIDARIVIKIPLTKAGAETASVLVSDGYRVTLTAVYAIHQALTGAGLRASYIAPYIGRMTDAGRDGRAEVADMREILLQSGPEAPRLLVASIRTVEDLVALARFGCNTFTLGPALAEALFDEPLTHSAAADFEAAAKAMGGGRPE